MRMTRRLLLVGILFPYLFARAGKVDTLMVKSPSMHDEIKVLVIAPEKPGRYPVVYMLHGHQGNACSWLNMVPRLPGIADEKGMIFVCPDGRNSWYWDSPLNENVRYETFLSKELVAYVDTHYPTWPDRQSRAITGLSMGGHGAMWLSFRHTDVFGAAGSMSGGMDIRPFPGNWNIQDQLGSKAGHPEVWDRHTVINQVERLKDGELALIIDCGYDDFFFEVNNRFHEKLLKNGIGHDYCVRPGRHDSTYWKNSIFYHLLFFERFFRQRH